MQEGIRRWRGENAKEIERIKRKKTEWRRKSIKKKSAIFDGPESAGADALLNQKPPTALPGLGDEQFRQYAFSVMSELIETMESALGD